MIWNEVLLFNRAEKTDFDFDSLSIPQMVFTVMFELVESLFAMFLLWGTLFIVFYWIPSELTKLL